MTRRLIVNADDLGLTPGVNRGILEAHRSGILTSTTTMINMPDAEAGIRLLQQEAPAVGIGLHFNLTTGRPVLPPQQVPSLVLPDGTFYYSSENPLERASLMHPDHIAAEMHAQFDRFVQVAGRKPDHLDSHHHAAYHIPAAFRVMLELADAHDLPVRRAVDWNANGALNGPAPRTTDCFEARFYEDGATVENLLSILENLPQGVTELMCHPAYNDAIAQGYAAQREKELNVLTDPAVRACIEQQQIELITFAEMPSQS